MVMYGNINDFSMSLLDSLTDNLKIAYKKVKTLIKRIYQRCSKKNIELIKDEFEEAYVDFACLLDDEGHEDESFFCMSIFSSYKYVMDNPDALVELKDFFRDYFAAFDELLYTKINDSENYPAKYDEFLIYWVEMDSYFVSNYVTRSEYYDKETIVKIINGVERMMK